MCEIFSSSGAKIKEDLERLYEKVLEDQTGHFTKLSPLRLCLVLDNGMRGLQDLLDPEVGFVDALTYRWNGYFKLTKIALRNV
jgi:hypothetical protein